jgi:hypothetical protein
MTRIRTQQLQRRSMFASVMVCTLSVRPPPQRPHDKDPHHVAPPKHQLIGMIGHLAGAVARPAGPAPYRRDNWRSEEAANCAKPRNWVG